jgi:phosphocarrier protein HPr
VKEKELMIENKLGIHARAAAQIMGIMMLAAAKGTTVLIAVHGTDEKDAYAAMEKLFKDKFGEKE